MKFIISLGILLGTFVTPSLDAATGLELTGLKNKPEMQLSSKILVGPQPKDTVFEAAQLNKEVSFEERLATRNTTTLVSLDIPFDDGLEVSAKATPPPPEPEPEPEPEVMEEFVYEETSGYSTTTETSFYPDLPVGNSITETALQFVGYPYIYGGSSPSGFDCSGFTSYVYAQHGISLPRTSYAQSEAGITIPASEAKPGDLVISNGGGHVMIYLGDGMVVHASTPATGVKVSGIWGTHWFVRIQ